MPIIHETLFLLLQAPNFNFNFNFSSHSVFNSSTHHLVSLMEKTREKGFLGSLFVHQSNGHNLAQMEIQDRTSYSKLINIHVPRWIARKSNSTLKFSGICRQMRDILADEMASSIENSWSLITRILFRQMDYPLPQIRRMNNLVKCPKYFTNPSDHKRPKSSHATNYFTTQEPKTKIHVNGVTRLESICTICKSKTQNLFSLIFSH